MFTNNTYDRRHQRLLPKMRVASAVRQPAGLVIAVMYLVALINAIDIFIDKLRDRL